MNSKIERETAAQLYGVEFSPWIRRVSIALSLFFIIVPVLSLLAPWVQNINGRGRVAAFAPLDRPQSVQSPIKGRVAEVFVNESQLVKKGDPLVRLIDIDPEKIARLDAKLEAARLDLQFTKMNVSTFDGQVQILGQARDLAVNAFEAKVEVANEKLRASEQKLKGAKAELEFAREQQQRMARLAPEFVEEIKLLEANAKLGKANANVKAIEAELQAARAGLRNANAELGKERQLANSKVEEVRAKMQSESGKAADVQAKIADLQGELRAQRTQLVEAPRAGRVFRLTVNTESSIVKEGEELLRIVPTAARTAVELWVRGVDAPLIDPGRKVRIQFEGWPALRFSGWPSAAVGTFGGIVHLVDPADDGNGEFRLLIVPDPNDEPWPDERWLRQGSRVKAWVLLNEVTLAYEMWRQLNGFPPVVSAPEMAKDSKPGIGK